MQNVTKFVNALIAQVQGRTEESLRIVETVEPMQSGDAIEVFQAILLHPRKRDLIDLLVNSAIFGMTDQRIAPVTTLQEAIGGQDEKKN